MNLCDYGCNNAGLFFNPRKKKFCCCQDARKCPEVRRQNKIRQQSLEVNNKKMKTFKKNFGVEHPMKNDLVKQKLKDTNIKKYGVDNPSKNIDIKNKIRKTNIEKYGVEFTFQSDEIKSKIKDTFLKKYQVTHPMKSSEIKNKVRQTNIEKYGVENPGQTLNSRLIASRKKSTETKEKMKQTWRSKTNDEKKSIIDKRELTTGYRTPFQISKNRSKSSISKKERRWLESLNNKNLIYQYNIPNSTICVDGYDSLTNTIYLFHGDFWHGNLKKFNPDHINPRIKKTYRQLYEETIKYESYLKELGYNLIIMWESDFNG